MQFNNVRFIGQLRIDKLDENGEYRKEFLEKFKLFMKAKDDVVLFSVNEYNYDNEKLQCSIKGECLSYMEARIDERLLNSYIHEFRIQFKYDLRMYRLFNDKEGTELLPSEDEKNKSEIISPNNDEEIAVDSDSSKDVIKAQKEEKHEEEITKNESVKEVPEHEEHEKLEYDSVLVEYRKNQEDGKEIKVDVKAPEKIVQTIETPKVTPASIPKEPVVLSAKSEPYLYHYTTIENLALILKNKTIKFNNLSKIKSNNNANIESSLYDKFCFISSWTKERFETMELWNMYTDKKGVRIKLPTDPFKMYLYDGGSAKMNSNINISEYFKNIKNYQMASLKTINAVDLGYVKGASKMFPKIEVMDKNTFMNYSNKIGLYKEDIYSNEKECVYRMFIYPWMLEESKKVMSNSDEIKNRFNNIVLPFNERFLNLDENKFKDMEIVLGPECGEGEKTIVELLVSKYNPSAVIRESALKR